MIVNHVKYKKLAFQCALRAFKPIIRFKSYGWTGGPTDRWTNDKVLYIYWWSRGQSHSLLFHPTLNTLERGTLRVPSNFSSHLLACASAGELLWSEFWSRNGTQHQQLIVSRDILIWWRDLISGSYWPDNNISFSDYFRHYLTPKSKKN